MYRKIKILILTGIFTLGAFVLNAQTDPGKLKGQGEIVMTRAELQNFLERIAKARKEKVEQELENSSLSKSSFQYSGNNYGNNYGVSTATAPASPRIPLSSYVPVQSMSRNELLREIDALNSRMNYMYGYGGGGSGPGNSTTFLTQPGGGQGGYYQSQPPIVIGAPQTKTDNSDLRWKIDSLQQKVSLLSSASLVPVASVDSIATADSISSNDVVDEKIEEIIKLKREIELTQDSLIALSALTSEAKDLVKEYGTSQMQVFFDNNVSEVSSRYKDEVEKAAIALRKNPQLSVVLKGYASPLGNFKLNQDLSMRRNEAVKRMLIDYGVFPDQISSVFYGEDTTSTASEARRVDIKFIVK